MNTPPAQQPPDFPDDGTCRVAETELEDSLECLNMWGSFCPFSILHLKQRFCRHSTAREILAKSQAAE